MGRYTRPTTAAPANPSPASTDPGRSALRLTLRLITIHEAIHHNPHQITDSTTNSTTDIAPVPRTTLRVADTMTIPMTMATIAATQRQAKRMLALGVLQI